MRDNALRVEQYRSSTPPSDYGALWGAFLVRKMGYDLRIISSGPADHPEAMGWEHVSVSRTDWKVPTWSDMCLVKELFWDDDETVVQFHPKRSEYVNVHPGVLHLWKKAGSEYELPPRILLAPDHNPQE